MKKLISILCSLLLLSACFKEEEPRGTIESFETLVLGEEYDNQFFYSLFDTTIVSSNKYKDWSIALYSGDDACYIRLNAAANMWAVKTNSTDFNTSFTSLYDESEKRFDGSHGFKNNLAIDMSMSQGFSLDTLRNQKMVYLIHPGVSSDGNEMGEYKKFMFEGLYQDSYVFKYANLDGSDFHKVCIPKNTNVNYTTFSFNTNSVVNIEPDKATWDLLFSRFTDTVYTVDGSEFLTGYSVTGAYLNENGVRAYLEEDIAYDDISSQNIDMARLSSKINTIGHDWKQFIEQYYIFKNRTYIVEDRDGRMFKLRFLSFYDAETGAKGSISFEFELVQ